MNTSLLYGAAILLIVGGLLGGVYSNFSTPFGHACAYSAETGDTFWTNTNGRLEADLQRGWHLIGAPGEFFTPETQPINYLTSSEPYVRYNPGLESYEVNGQDASISFMKGAGFWYYVQNAGTFVLENSYPVDTKISLTPGWNQITVPRPVSVKLSSISANGNPLSDAVTSSALYQYLWMYNPVLDCNGDSYVYIDVQSDDALLHPGVGYWVYAYEDVELEFGEENNVPKCWATNGICDGSCTFETSTEFKHFSPECSKTCRETKNYFQLSGTCNEKGEGTCFKQTGQSVVTTICPTQLKFPYGDSSCSGDGGDWCVDGSDYSKGTNCQVYEDISTDAIECLWVDPEEVMHVKLFVLTYDPIIESEGKKLHEVYGWEDPATLTQKMIQDLRKSSHGIVNYDIVENVLVDGFPPYKNGCSYTDESYREGLANFYDSGSEEGFCGNTEIDMAKIDALYGISEKVESREVDELFLWGAPGASYPWESAMAGTGAYWINGPPELGISSSKVFVIMGLNYERGVAEALESYGHRSEWILQKIFNGGGWDGYTKHEGNAWDRFLIKDIDVAGKGGVGDIHDAVNAREGHGYDRSSRDIVLSNADEWLNYPDIDYTNRRDLWCNEWGCDVEGNNDARAYENWWYYHLPHAPGETDGKFNNWWKYIVDMEYALEGDENPELLVRIE
jgi:hypothetical protein